MFVRPILTAAAAVVLLGCANENATEDAPPLPGPAERAQDAQPPPPSQSVNPPAAAGQSLPQTPPILPTEPGRADDDAMPPGPVNP